MIVAIYPGSFDPITNGHIDIATRASKLFGKAIVGVFKTPAKNIIFDVEERVALARKALAHLPNVEVSSFSGLTVDFARSVDAKVMVRGMRMSADFEREFEMAMMNKKLYPDLELVCLMTRVEYQFLSSSLLKEVACLEGNVSDMVPGHVAEAIRKKARRQA